MNNTNKKLSYLGPKGTYSEEAALIYTNHNELLLVAEKTIYDVLEKVETSEEIEGIVPLENSRVGTILETIDWFKVNDNLIKYKADKYTT